MVASMVVATIRTVLIQKIFHNLVQYKQGGITDSLCRPIKSYRNILLN